MLLNHCRKIFSFGLVVFSSLVGRDLAEVPTFSTQLRIESRIGLSPKDDTCGKPKKLVHYIHSFVTH